MKITYLNHSGYMIELEKNILIFDCISPLDKNIFKDKNVFFMISHSHSDHFREKIFEYKDNNVNYILSDDIKANENTENIFYIAPYESLKIKDISINTFSSTDRGVSFLAEAEGKIFFFSGDLNWWHWENNTEEENEKEATDYKNEIIKLKHHLNNNILDVAFIPVDTRLNKAQILSAKYFIKEINVKNLFPMHFWKDLGYIENLKTLKKENLKIFYPKEKNENFIIQ